MPLLRRIHAHLRDAVALQVYSGTATLLWGLWVGVFGAFTTAPSVYASFAHALTAPQWGWLALLSGVLQLCTLGGSPRHRQLSALVAAGWWGFLAGGFASAAWRVTAVPNYACQSALAVAWYWLLGGRRE